MATVISKIVKCTLEQYETLLKTGQVEIDGTIRYKEEGTLYIPYELDFIEFYNRVKESELFRYEISHTPLTMKSLEEEYNDIAVDLITDENTQMSKYVSAVGYTALLKNGDTIKVTSTNTGIFFINGEKTTKDYSYTGDGIELVNVWAFEGKSGDFMVGPGLSDSPTFAITELDVRNINEAPTIGDSYKNYALKIKAYNFAISGLSTRQLISNGTATFNQSSAASGIEEVESDCSKIDGTTTSALYSKTKLKKASFPNLTEITAVSGGVFGFLNSCSNPNLEIRMDKLVSIGNSQNAVNSPFHKVVKVVFPESVKSIGQYACNSNTTIILNCNKATNINSKWCGTTPTNFAVCDDWRASINIAIAAKNHTIDWFINLFKNKLHDFAADSADGAGEIFVAEITIPLAIFEAMTEEVLAIAENKNWTVGGA